MRRLAASALVLTVITASCGGDDESSPTPADEPATAEAVDRVVKIDGDRGLYIKCAGRGSPTVVMEGGDGDTSDSYAFAAPEVTQVTRTCVYDRANLGRSDPAPGPRGLAELVRDLEQLLRAGKVPGPYLLVGTSGGGYIAAGFAYAHPEETAGLVFVDTASPFRDPPPEIVEETDPDSPANVEKRDYLQVEKDAWNARRKIGDIPVKVITVKPSAEAIKESPFPSERRAIRNNVRNQKGWLVLSPAAEQILVDTGHAVEEDDPELVIDVILDALEEARESP